MLARFDRSGRLIYREILSDFQKHRVLALFSDDAGDYLALKLKQESRARRPVFSADISLYRIDEHGGLSRPIATVEGVGFEAVAAYRDVDESGLLIAAAKTAGRTIDEIRELDVRLFDMTTTGQVRRRPFPAGVKGVSALHATNNGGVVYFDAQQAHSYPTGLAHVDSRGRLTSLMSFESYSKTRNRPQLLSERVLTISDPPPDSTSMMISAYSLQGELLWEHETVLLGSPVHAFELNDGGLVVGGSFQDNPVLIRLDSTGKRVWTQRFASSKYGARVNAVSELSDGWLAIAGATTPGSGVFVAMDADAFLLAAPPDGQGLTPFQKCLADADELRGLLVELERRTGIRVEREVLSSGRTPTPLEELPPLNEKLAARNHCRPVSELDYVAFLRQMLDTAEALGVPLPAKKTSVSVLLRAQEALNDRPMGYYEWPHRRWAFRPALAIGHESAVDGMKYIARECIPFIAAMKNAVGGVRDKLGIRFYPGTPYPISKGAPKFRELAAVTSAVVDAFGQLNNVRKAKFKQLYESSRLSISNDPSVLHVLDYNSPVIVVGKNKVEGMFGFLLDEVPAEQDKIRILTGRIREELNILIRKSDVDLYHTSYRETLQGILDSAESLTNPQLLSVRASEVYVNVSGRLRSDLTLSNSRRQITMRPVAASHLLEFVLDHTNELAMQEPGRR